VKNNSNGTLTAISNSTGTTTSSMPQPQKQQLHSPDSTGAISPPNVSKQFFNVPKSGAALEVKQLLSANDDGE